MERQYPKRVLNSDTYTTPDCRCAICGCCQHDHMGWYHGWTAKFPWEVNNVDPSEFPRLQRFQAA